MNFSIVSEIVYNIKSIPTPNFDRKEKGIQRKLNTAQICVHINKILSNLISPTEQS